MMCLSEMISIYDTVVIRKIVLMIAMEFDGTKDIIIDFSELWELVIDVYVPLYVTLAKNGVLFILAVIIAKITMNSFRYSTKHSKITE